MNVTEITYVLAVLFVYGEHNRDWMATISAEGDGPWLILRRLA